MIEFANAVLQPDGWWALLAAGIVPLYFAVRLVIFWCGGFDD